MDSGLSKRNRGNKRRGAHWEVTIREYLLKLGLKVQRLTRNGSKDIGDLVVFTDNGHHYIIEAKDVSTSSLAQWCSEAEVEADNYAQLNRLDRGWVHWIVVWKRRRHGVERAYVMTSLEEWAAGLG